MASAPEAASFPLARALGIAPLPSSGGGSASSRKRSAWVGEGRGIGDLGAASKTHARWWLGAQEAPASPPSPTGSAELPRAAAQARPEEAQEAEVVAAKGGRGGVSSTVLGDEERQQGG